MACQASNPDHKWVYQVSSTAWHVGGEAIKKGQLKILEDIVGNPFQTMPFDSSWLTKNSGEVVNIARAIYNNRWFEMMPVLAEKLIEAGCFEKDILNHCREPSDHVYAVVG